MLWCHLNSKVTDLASAAFEISVDNVWSLWPFVNKIEWSVVNFSRSVFLSSHFAKFWHENAHASDILLSDTNVIFSPLGCGLSILGTVYLLQIRWKRQRYVWMSNPYVGNSSEVAVIFNSWQEASTLGLRNTSLLCRDHTFYSYFFCLLAAALILNLFSSCFWRTRNLPHRAYQMHFSKGKLFYKDYCQRKNVSGKRQIYK